MSHVFLLILSVTALSSCVSQNSNTTSQHQDFHKGATLEISSKIHEGATLEISSKIHDTSDIPFLPHEGAGAFGSYVTLELPYGPAEYLYNQISKPDSEFYVGRALKNRGEAHITVVTPPEFDKVLRTHLSIKEVNKIAGPPVQKSKFEVKCLGKGQASVSGKTEATYFVVVKSDDLVAVRKKLEAAYLQKGGKAGEFKPEEFFPHITLGFTARDLHLEDEVIKDEVSCFANLKVVSN